ncbi:MAG: hypothetical protein R2762_11010 [Bryobacteraceae bacterium]
MRQLEKHLLAETEDSTAQHAGDDWESGDHALAEPSNAIPADGQQTTSAKWGLFR